MTSMIDIFQVRIIARINSLNLDSIHNANLINFKMNNIKDCFSIKENVADHKTYVDKIWKKKQIAVNPNIMIIRI